MVLFVFQSYPVCNFGLGTLGSERVKVRKILHPIVYLKICGNKMLFFGDL